MLAKDGSLINDAATLHARGPRRRLRREQAPLPDALLLHADPDLATGVPAAELAVAERCLRVPVTRVGRGEWDPGSLLDERLLSVIVLRGLLLREVFVGDRVRAELLGPGDVLRPWEQESFEALDVGYRCSWTALDVVDLGHLDARFGRIAARWPEITSRLMQRMAQRSQRLALQLAIGELQGVDVRLRTMLWYLAERWGHVTPQGVVVPFALTHETLGRLVGARRPSVTTALSSLAEEGTVRRFDDGRWLLELPDLPHAAAS